MSGCGQGQIQHTLLTMTNFLLTLHQQRPAVLAATCICLDCEALFILFLHLETE